MLVPHLLERRPPWIIAPALLAGALATGCSAPGSTPPAPASTASAGDGGGGTTSAPTGMVSLPFVVSDQFVPSGFMGDSPSDFNAIMMSSDATKCLPRQPGVKGACYTVTWTPQPLAGQKTAWVGVYWQYPSNNWGAKPGKAVAAGATKVTFSAAGAAGGEQVEFIAGGVNTTGGNASLPYADTFTARTTVTLTKSWATYEVPLAGDSYTSVIGAFAWSITTSSTTPVTFYVDDIEWE